MCTKRKTTEEFVQLATGIHDNVYDYTQVNYKNMHTKVTIVCDKHGAFEQRPYAHIHGMQGCPSCKGTPKHSTASFIEKANTLHNNFYDYSSTVYTSSHNLVAIICPIHGQFLQQAYVHLQQHGCPACGIETTSKKNKENTDTWTYHGWEAAGIASAEFVGYTLYIIELWDNDESFIKIGKSFTSLTRRFRGAFSYDWKLLKTYTGSASYISKLEKELHKEYKTYQHIPKQKFDGSTECFTIELKDHINDIDTRATSNT